MRLSIVFIGLCLLVKLFVHTSATQEIKTISNVSVRQRRCPTYCYTGRSGSSWARRTCPGGRSRRCNGRGYQCICATSASPSPSPLPRGRGPLSLYILGGRSKVIRILRCTTSAFFAEVDARHTVMNGLILWNSPRRGENICDGCNSLMRKVRSFRFASSFGSTRCPSGKLCVVATTSYASFGDLFSSTFLRAFQLQRFLRTALEPKLGCRLPRSARTIRDALHLPQTSAKQSNPTMPTKCSDWESKDSLGRCKFSNCFVGPSGDPKNCFFCKPNCFDGCGPGYPANFLIRDRIPLLFDFRDACCNHDKCYASTFSKSECDNAFFRQLLRSCIDSPLDIFYYIRLPLGTLGSPLRCQGWATVYYLAVAIGGGSFHDEAQRDRMKHEESNDCTAKCPTTQRSGGQGTLTLPVDLKKTSGTFKVSYQMYRIPDSLVIKYEGKTIFTTGGLVSGSRTVSVSYRGRSTVVQVTLSAPRSGTAWNLAVACP